MSDFFDKLGAAAKRAAGTVSTEVSVAAEEQKIREQYQALGKLYYQAIGMGKAPAGEQFSACCDRIRTSFQRINDLKSANDVTGSTVTEDDFVDLG